MDVLSFILYFALTLVLMLIGLRNVPLLLLFSGVIGFLGAALLVAGGLSFPIGSCVFNGAASICTSSNLTISGTPAALLLAALTLFSWSMFAHIITGSDKEE